MSEITICEPFPIYLTGERYLLYDIDTITYVRRAHNICGVLIGTIPHISQQNVFSGIPLQLMPEEARLLVEKGHAYMVDDVQLHGAMMQLSKEERDVFRRFLEKQSKEASQSSQKHANKRKQDWLLRKSETKDLSERRAKWEEAGDKAPAGTLDANGESLFDSPVPIPAKARVKPGIEQFSVTPATSHPPLPLPARASALRLPTVTHSYPLFAHLHSKGFFMSPGLRFGCQFCVYPGDPLRYHSHYLAVGRHWNEEFQLLEIVGGGRLGTAVKKAFVLGGAKSALQEDREAAVSADGGSVRAFCIEWAGM